MPIQLPNLDDRRYEDLVEEARGMIPGNAPAWTDHNTADPGITLIEMFAFLTEIMVYRLNRLSEDTLSRFVKLMRGPEWVRDPNKTIVEETRGAVLELRRRERAVTNEDFERLTLEAAPTTIARACCLPGLGPSATGPGSTLIERPEFITVLVVPQADTQTLPVPSDALLQTVRDYLEPRRLLTTRVHVTAPSYFQIDVSITVVPRVDRVEQRVRDDVVSALMRFLSPLSGGPEGRGWPFGRAVYVSEIYDLVDRLPSVDHVKRTVQGKTQIDELAVVDKSAVTDPRRFDRNSAGDLVAIRLARHELVNPRFVVAVLDK
jgi:hypothetical protein